MTLFWKTSAVALIALILILTLGKQEQDMSTILSIAVCSMTGIAALQLWEPVMTFLYQIQLLSSLEDSMLRRLLQITGIGLAGELIGLICSDAGSSSLGKSVQFLASSAILYLSIPFFESMLELIQEIMGGL